MGLNEMESLASTPLCDIVTPGGWARMNAYIKCKKKGLEKVDRKAKSKAKSKAKGKAKGKAKAQGKAKGKMDKVKGDGKGKHKVKGEGKGKHKVTGEGKGNVMCIDEDQKKHFKCEHSKAYHRKLKAALREGIADPVAKKLAQEADRE